MHVLPHRHEKITHLEYNKPNTPVLLGLFECSVKSRITGRIEKKSIYERKELESQSTFKHK